MPTSKNLKSIPQYLVVDDEIIESSDKEDFQEDTGLPLEYSIFVQSYEEALDVLTSNSNIILCFVDIRIPKNRQEKYEEDTGQIWQWQDYIKEKVINIQEEYGVKLLSKIKDIATYIYSAYAELSSLKKVAHSHDIVKGCFRKTGVPPKIQDEIESYLEFFTQENSSTIVSVSNNFDYSLLDEETSIFVQQKTREIKRSTERVKEDIMKIGNYLIEVKDRLEYGYFRAWLEAEFEWGSIRTAARFMNVAQKFTSDTVAHLDILPSALYKLSSRSFPESGLTEALERAEQGERITGKLADEIASRHKFPKKETSKNSENITVKRAKKNNTKELLFQLGVTGAEKKEIPKILPSSKKEHPKQAVLKVISDTKLAKNTWWQLGRDHRLFCGEPKADSFSEKLLSLGITLVVNSPPNEDHSKIPSIKSGLEISFRSQYCDVDLDSLANGLDDFLAKTTNPKDTVVFCYLFNVKLLEIAANRGCHCIVAEPDLENCNKILAHWRSKESVKRILPSQ